MADDNNIMSFLQGASMRNNDNSWGGGNGFGILLILLLFMMGGRGFGSWGGNGMAAAAMMNSANNNRNDNMQFETLMSGQNQLRDQMNYNGLMESINDFSKQSAAQTYTTNNAVNTGFSDTRSALCQGFNGVNTAISNTGWMLAEKLSTLAGQNNLQLQAIQNSMVQGIGDIKNTISSSMQTVLDKMCSNEIQNLRERLFEASQREQTTSIVSQLKTTASA